MTSQPIFFVIGSGSGTGKTTLASYIHRDLDSRGLPVRCFYEIEIQSAREFGSFRKRFVNGDPEMKDALCTAIEAFASREMRNEEWVIAESLFPFLRWLVLGHCPRPLIEDYCAWLKNYFLGLDVTLIALRCSKDLAISRARTDRGDEWFRQWTERQRNYPLYKADPSLDIWHVFEQEMSFAHLLSWPTLEFDTEQSSLDEIVTELFAERDLPALKRRETAIAPSGLYHAQRAPHPLLTELEISDDRIKMMGVWLDLIPSSDGSIRIENSNSTVDFDPYGATLNSIRFGHVRYEPST